MMDEFETIGQWWLPSNMNNKKLGRLTFSHTDGLLLEIYGSFLLDSVEPGTERAVDTVQSHPLIEGITRNGKRFSIFGCLSAGFSASVPGFFSEKFHGSYGFENSYIESEKGVATKFSKACVQFNYLPDWVGFSGIQQSSSFNSETKVVDRLEIVYEPVNKITVDLDDFTVSIAQGY